MSKLTKDGVSTTTRPGQFQHEKFFSSGTRKHMVAWDYRDLHGVLHSGISKTIEAAKTAAAKHGYYGS